MQHWGRTFRKTSERTTGMFECVVRIQVEAGPASAPADPDSAAEEVLWAFERNDGPRYHLIASAVVESVEFKPLSK